MDKIDYNNLINESINENLFSYTLNQEQIFSEVGYKVLQNQEQNGLIKCSKALQNGDIELIYDTSKYHPLTSILQSIDKKQYTLIVNKLYEVIEYIKENGFIHCENLDINLNKIFVDTTDYSVYLICLPFNIMTKFEDKNELYLKLKKYLSNAVNNNEHLKDENIIKLIDVYTDKQKQEELPNTKQQAVEYLDDRKYEKNEKVNKYIQESINDDKQIPNNYNKSSKISFKVASIIIIISQMLVIISTLATSKFMSDKAIPIIGGVLLIDIILTTVLLKISLNKVKLQPLSLVSVNSDDKVKFVIDKPIFVIGKKADSVDGVISHDKTVSKIHCKIIQRDERYYITDMESLNGTYVNNKKIEQSNMVLISRGDIIKLSKLEFVVK